MNTMKAAVIYEAGGSEALTLESRPIPVPKNGEVLIRVKGNVPLHRCVASRGKHSA